MNDSLYGNFRNRKFTDIFQDYEAFHTTFTEIDIPGFAEVVSQESLKIIYYLLYARYGNSVIASSDENQFKYKLFTIIWQYGPTWQKNLEIQKALRNLQENDILAGGKAIYNHAYNPGTAPATDDPTILTYINDQNTTNYRKSKLEGYAILSSLLAADVSEEFISHFKKLFLTIVEPENPLWYVSED